MDTSYWINLVPTLKFVETKKILYKKYLFNIKLRAFGIGSHVYFRGNSEKLSKAQIKIDSHGFFTLNNFNTEKANFQLNHCLYKKFILDKQIKYRIERSYITFYAINEEIILEILEELKRYNVLNSAIQISLPDPNKIEDLKNGSIIVKNIDPKYKFKVIIGSSCINDEQYALRRQIFEYLYNLNDSVYKLNLNKILQHSRWSYRETYFYCVDESIVVFLKLIAPSLIGKTFRVINTSYK